MKFDYAPVVKWLKTPDCKSGIVGSNPTGSLAACVRMRPLVWAWTALGELSLIGKARALKTRSNRVTGVWVRVPGSPYQKKVVGSMKTEKKLQWFEKEKWYGNLVRYAEQNGLNNRKEIKRNDKRSETRTAQGKSK